MPGHYNKAPASGEAFWCSEQPLIRVDDPVVQDWRAIVELGDGQERLVCLGADEAEVRACYSSAFQEVCTAEDREYIEAVWLEVWEGRTGIGRWVRRTALPVPHGGGSA